MLIWIEIVSSLFIFAGVIFIVISSVGLIRLPDFYVRISAITKAITLGITLILIGIGIYFNDLIIGSKILAIISFMMLTSPVSAHIIARAATRDKVPFWEKTQLEEFKPYLEKQQHEKERQQEENRGGEVETL
jgi:multicomponent Na+:H+ antiporter subunit G